MSTIIQMSSAIFDAIECCDDEVMRVADSCNVQEVKVHSDGYKETTLEYALRKGRSARVIKHLLDLGAKPYQNYYIAENEISYYDCPFVLAGENQEIIQLMFDRGMQCQCAFNALDVAIRLHEFKLIPLFVSKGLKTTNIDDLIDCAAAMSDECLTMVINTIPEDKRVLTPQHKKIMECHARRHLFKDRKMYDFCRDALLELLPRSDVFTKIPELLDSIEVRSYKLLLDRGFRETTQHRCHLKSETTYHLTESTRRLAE